MYQWNCALPPSFSRGPVKANAGHHAGWTSMGRKREQIETERRSDTSRRNFHEHFMIIGWTSSVGTKDGEQETLRRKIHKFRVEKFDLEFPTLLPTISKGPS